MGLGILRNRGFCLRGWLGKILLGEGKRWRGVNGVRGKGIGERKDGAGSDFLGVISVANIERRGGLWFGSKNRGGVKSLQIERGSKACYGCHRG